MSSQAHVVGRMYEVLYERYGAQHWWPGETPTEVVIGAILTQNTAWSNVEKAIDCLRKEDALDLYVVNRMSEEQLGKLIRSAGTYRVKAKRLKAFAAWLHDEYGGELAAALSGAVANKRAELLSITGIGPETADAILLYAGGQLTFVVDAYTRRVLRRHHVLPGHASYEEVKELFEQNLPEDVQLYNEYHALLVELGKRHCRVKADCEHCPLAGWPHDESL